MRLAIIDALAVSDRSPSELRLLVGLESNLLAHHLDVLEGVGLLERTRSHGDGRRRYVRLIATVPAPAPVPVPGGSSALGPALFVCTANAARSQIAAALWTEMTHQPASSAGTHPASAVHPGAIAALARVGLEPVGGAPTDVAALRQLPPRVITVCDAAHEELGDQLGWIHWSIPDPVIVGTDQVFDATLLQLRDRIARLIGEAA